MSTDLKYNGVYRAHTSWMDNSDTCQCM